MWPRRSLRRRRASNTGFALVEVLVTIAILAIVGSITYASLGQRAPALARSEAGEIALLLQRARLEAAERGRPVEISWDAQTRRFIAGAHSHDLARGVSGPAEPLRLTIAPTGASPGLVFEVTADGYVVTVRLDGLTGRVARAS